LDLLSRVGYDHLGCLLCIVMFVFGGVAYVYICVFLVDWVRLCFGFVYIWILFRVHFYWFLCFHCWLWLFTSQRGHCEI